jgi:hypothetical protein
LIIADFTTLSIQICHITAHIMYLPFTLIWDDLCVSMNDFI